MEFSVIDSIVFVILTAFSLYSLDAVEFKKILKSNQPRQALLFYMLVSLALSALVFTFYIYLKIVMIGM